MRRNLKACPYALYKVEHDLLTVKLMHVKSFGELIKKKIFILSIF